MVLTAQTYAKKADDDLGDECSSHYFETVFISFFYRYKTRTSTQLEINAIKKILFSLYKIVFYSEIKKIHECDLYHDRVLHKVAFGNN